MKKVLLIAKPWRGGLARYVYLALEQLFPGRVEWIATRPDGWAEQLSYRCNKKLWEQLLLERVQTAERELAIFINHLPVFSSLEYHPGNVLWLTDGPSPTPGDYDPYARVYLSDAGYLTNVARVVAPERLAGELGFACSPEVHKADPGIAEKKQICFIGNKDPERDPYLEALLQSDYSVSIVGNYFLRHPFFWSYPTKFLPSVENEKMGQIYAAHQISLNLHARIVRQGTNMRTFESAAYGIPQLVEYRPGIENYFELEKEILTFSNTEEMLEKAKKLLGDKQFKKQLAGNAQSRVMAEHTYRHRVQTILDHL